MLARTADSLYWMSRYMERVDIILRTLGNGYHASYDINTQQIFNWKSIVGLFCNTTPEKIDAISETSDTVLRQLLVDDENNSLRQLVTKARENARGTQDHLTKEVWEAINEKYHSAINVDLDTAIKNGEQINLLLAHINESLVYYGVVENTMPRQQGWNFMNLGRFIERSIQTLNFAQLKFEDIDKGKSEGAHILFWKDLLLNLSGYELYLKSYRINTHTDNIIDMVFLNSSFPRSILYTIKKVQLYIKNILSENENPNNKLIERKSGMLCASVSFADLETIHQKGVLNFITELKTNLYELSQLISHTYFLYY